MKFHVDALHNFKSMLRTKFKYENKQRAIAPKVWNFEVWFLCTSLLLNKIFDSTSFKEPTLTYRGLNLSLVKLNNEDKFNFKRFIEK